MTANDKISPFSFVNGLNSGNYLEFENNESQYIPFVINRHLSYFVDCLSYVQDLNLAGNLDIDMQYEYLKHSIRPRKRFTRWSKSKVREEVDIIQKYLNCSRQKAKEILPLLKENEIQEIREIVNDSG